MLSVNSKLFIARFSKIKVHAGFLVGRNVSVLSCLIYDLYQP